MAQCYLYENATLACSAAPVTDTEDGTGVAYGDPIPGLTGVGVNVETNNQEIDLLDSPDTIITCITGKKLRLNLSGIVCFEDADWAAMESAALNCERKYFRYRIQEGSGFREFVGPATLLNWSIPAGIRDTMRFTADLIFDTYVTQFQP